MDSRDPNCRPPAAHSGHRRLDRIMHLNANGLRSRLSELLPAMRHCMALSLQDTRTTDPQFYVDTFPEYYCYSQSTTAGCPGHALLVHRDVRHTMIDALEDTGQSFFQVEIDDRRFGPTFRLSTLYAPPSRRHGPLNTTFLTQGLTHPRSILLGDLNARHRCLGASSSNTNGRVLAAFLDHHDVTILNDVCTPTFCHTGRAYTACLDYAVATPMATELIRSTVVEADLGSDHLPVVLYLRRSFTARPTSTPRYLFPLDQDFSDYQDNVDTALRHSSIWPHVPSTTTADLDFKCQDIITTISSVAASAFPPPRLACPDRPRLPAHVLLLIRSRRALRRTYAASPTATTKHQINQLSKAIRQEIKLTKAMIAEAHIQAIASGPTHPQFWTKVRSHFRGPVARPPPLRDPTLPQRFLTPAETTEAFTSQLRTLLTVDATIPSLSPESPSSPTRESSSQPVFNLPPLDSCTLRRLFTKCRRNRSPGPDTLPYEVWRHGPPSLHDLICHLINDMMRLQHVPQFLKNSNIAVVPKPGKDPSNTLNYRPITLSNTFLKIFERYLNHYLLLFLSRHKILPEHLYAFRNNTSSGEPLLHMVEDAIHQFNVGNITALMSLDLTKAFDCVSHDHLLSAVHFHTRSPQFCTIVRSLIMDRHTRIRHNGDEGPFFRPTRGVPQGSSLAPTLFNMLMATMPPPSSSCLKLYIYADDINLTSSAETANEAWHQLRPYLTTISTWLTQQNLQLQPQKTQLTFLTRRRHPLAIPNCTFLGHSIRPASEITILGIILDQRLTMLPHAKSLVDKLEPTIHLLRYLLQYHRNIPRYVGLTLYRTLIWPIIAYGTPLLLRASPSTWRMLDGAHNRALRAATRSPRGTPLQVLHLRARRLDIKQEYVNISQNYLFKAQATENRRILQHLQYKGQAVRLVRTSSPLFVTFTSLQPVEQLDIQNTMTKLRLHPP